MGINNKSSNVISVVLAVSLLFGMSGPTTTLAEGSPGVALGAAGNFVILSKSGISTTGSTLIVGDIGVSPAASTYMTGFGLVRPVASAFSTSAKVTGKVYAPDYANPTAANLTTAVLDMQKAYTEAMGKAPSVTELSGGNIGGLTLAPGVYKWGTGVTVPTDATLRGDANAVWVFQIAGTLNVSPAAKIILSGGARVSNIFWVVAGQTTIGTTAVFNGNILDQTAIALNTGAVLNGRALAQTAVTLDSNSVTMPSAAGTQPPSPVIAGISALTSAVISWDSDTPSDSQVEYGTTASYGLSSPLQDVSSPVTSHSVILSSLAPNTTYHYRVKSRDAKGNIMVSPDYVLTTSPPPTPPPPPTPMPTSPVSGISSRSITSTSTIISWTTDKPVYSTVEYGVTTRYGSLSIWQGISVATHSLLLSSLSPNTTYYYRIKSTDAEANESISAGYSFTTLAAQPTSPVTSPPILTSISAVNITATSTTISWTTNELSNSSVEYGMTTSYGSLTPWQDEDSARVTAHSVVLSPLTPNTTYHYNVKSRNAKGNMAISADYSFTTPAEISLNPLATPTATLTDISSSKITSSSATISWTTNILPDLGGGYEETNRYRSISRVEYGETTSYGKTLEWQGASQGALVITTPHTAVLSPLTPETTYHYRIKNIDVKGKSTLSPDYSFSTSATSTPVPGFPNTGITSSPFVVSLAILGILILGLVLFVVK